MRRKPIAPSWIRRGLMLVLCITLCGVASVSVAAQPVIPHAFYGTVVISGQPAAVGTVIEAREENGNRIRVGLDENPLTTTIVGEYGGSGVFDVRLVVQGDVEDGTPLAFYVNKAINETLSRTLLTSLTTLLVIAALLVFATGVIKTFGVALCIGVLIGTYSSVFVASPVYLIIKRMVPQNK